MKFINEEVITGIRTCIQKHLARITDASFFQRYITKEDIDRDRENTEEELLADKINITLAANFISKAYPYGKMLRQQSVINAVQKFIEKFEKGDLNTTLEAEIYHSAKLIAALNSVVGMEINIKARMRHYTEELKDAITSMLTTYWNYACFLQNALTWYEDDSFRKFIHILEPQVAPFQDIHRSCRAKSLHAGASYRAAEMILYGEELLEKLSRGKILNETSYKGLYNKHSLEKIRQVSQGEGLISNLRWTLSAAPIKAINRALRGDKEYADLRRDYLTAIIVIIWALFNRSAKKSKTIVRGSFKVVDPEANLFNFLKEYVHIATGSPEPGIFSNNEFAYSRISSHYNDEITQQYGIDTRFFGGDSTTEVLPCGHFHVLFGRFADGGFTFLKLEPVGLGNVSEMLSHVNNYLHSKLIAAENSSYREKDIHPALVRLYSSYCREFNLSPDGVQAIYSMLKHMQQPLKVSPSMSFMQKEVEKKQSNLRASFLGVAKQHGLMTSKYDMRRKGNEVLLDFVTREQERDWEDEIFDGLSCLDFSENYPTIDDVYQGMALSQLHACYPLLTQDSTSVSLDYTTGYLIPPKTNLIPCYRFYNCKYQSERLLFPPVVLSLDTEPNAHTLKDVLNYYKQSIKEITDFQRVIIPFGEYGKGQFFNVRHLVILILDFSADDCYVAHIIDPMNRLIFGHNQSEQILKDLTTILGEPIFSSRIFLGHQSIFDTKSCSYYGIKIIQAALDNEIVQDFKTKIPTPNSWCSTATNWLSENDKQTIWESSIKYLNFEIHKSGVSLVSSPILSQGAPLIFNDPPNTSLGENEFEDLLAEFTESTLKDKGSFLSIS